MARISMLTREITGHSLSNSTIGQFSTSHVMGLINLLSSTISTWTLTGDTATNWTILMPMATTISISQTALIRFRILYRISP